VRHRAKKNISAWKVAGKSQARSFFCYWAVSELGFTMSDLAPKFNISQPAVSVSAQSGEQIASENGYSLMDE